MSETKQSKITNDENIVCPFCGEEGFDKSGLKLHLIAYCEEYDNTAIRRPYFRW